MVGYFGFHVVHGDRGLIAWWNIKQRVSGAKEALAVATAEREKIQNRVRLLNPGSLDPDMLEERARLMLNYGHADEIVILTRRRKGGSNGNSGRKPDPAILRGHIERNSTRP
ncbi:MAG: septum formation initiator family protein [Rhodospirillales bacterium]|nr:septum formation initiator family protein [Rhodospirillales bacterium]